MESPARLVTLLALLALLGGCNESSGPSSPPPRSPATLSLDPALWSFLYSPNMPSHPTANPSGGWYFDFPATDGVHYLIVPVSGYANSSMSVGIEVTTTGDPLFDWRTNPNNTCGNPPSTPATVKLFLQRRGDDMAGTPGTTEFYRWWSVPSFSLAAGSATLAASIGDPSQWSSVLGKNGADAPSQFQQAMNDLAAAGITFGGGCFAGHGVFVTGGTARFGLSSAGLQ